MSDTGDMYSTPGDDTKGLKHVCFVVVVFFYQISFPPLFAFSYPLPFAGLDSAVKTLQPTTCSICMIKKRTNLYITVLSKGVLLVSYVYDFV